VTRCLDVACSVSHAEAFSNTVGEAMASGVPCIVTDVGDSATIVGDSGIVVENGDAASIAEAMLTMIRMGDEPRARLGRRARERIGSHFSLANIALRYETLYREVLVESAGA
jgi:glycosyltransferase involved in cell wall biosynthesis